jgi:hypothetical protein
MDGFFLPPAPLLHPEPMPLPFPVPDEDVFPQDIRERISLKLLAHNLVPRQLKSGVFVGQ